MEKYSSPETSKSKLEGGKTNLVASSQLVVKKKEKSVNLKKSRNSVAPHSKIVVDI